MQLKVKKIYPSKTIFYKQYYIYVLFIYSALSKTKYIRQYKTHLLYSRSSFSCLFPLGEQLNNRLYALKKVE